MADNRKAVVDKWKKKKQYKLFAPKIFGNMEFGNTVAIKPEQIIGRVIKTNLGSLTNQVKKKNVDVSLKITKIEGSNAQTELVGFEVKSSYLRRLFRRRTSKIESVLKIQSKDEKKMSVKCVVITFGKQELSKRKTIKKELVDYVTKTAKENSAEKFLEKIMEKTYFEELIPKIKKIAPISATEMEKVRVLL